MFIGVVFRKLLLFLLPIIAMYVWENVIVKKLTKKSQPKKDHTDKVIQGKVLPETKTLSS